MKNTIIITALLLATSAHASTPPQALFLTSPDNTIILHTCWYDAGAICSLVHDGLQYLNDTDHGRQLQSAVSFDGQGEANNPTEAGASYVTDGFNPHQSSSTLLSGDVTNGVLSTLNRPAYWIPVAGQRVSDVYFSKRVEFITPTVLRYETTFTVQPHASATFETLTAYLPAAFSQFWMLDVKARSPMPQPLADGPGEQPYPVIMATPDHKHAMGIYTQRDVGYGRWRFSADGVVKWNAVARVDQPSGTYRFVSYVVVGTFESVTADMITLAASIN